MNVKTPKKSRSFGLIAALLLALFAFGASLHINRTVFERLPHLEDEFAYLFQAKIFAGGHVTVPRDPSWQESKYFWQPFIIQPDTPFPGTQNYDRFGKYTPGWPLLLAIGAAFNAPWIVNAWVSALSVVLIYRMGRDIFSEAVGVVAALLLAISPMALILNATLMSHPSAMFFVLLFVYAYWRSTRVRGHWRPLIVWAIVAGLALGWVISTRPLTAVAMAIPVALHILSRLMEAFEGFKRPSLQKTAWVLVPAVALAIGVLPTGALWPGFNYLTVGNPTTNLYTLLWDYDIVGFGAGHGLMAGGHTFEYGLRNARTDLAFWLRDLNGWTLSSTVEKYAADNLGWGAGAGLSGLMIALGLIYGRKNEWVWLCFELLIALILAQMTYWIGSVVYGSANYSVRYYYEATGAAMLVIAYGLVALSRQLRSKAPLVLALPLTLRSWLKVIWRRVWPGYVLITIAAGFALIGYVPARIVEPIHDWPNGLFRLNEVGQQELNALNAMRTPGTPVLVLVLTHPDGSGDDWRDYGALMASTSPYLDSNIVVARVFNISEADGVIRHFPGRQVLYEIGTQFYRSRDEALGGKQSRLSGPPAGLRF